MEWNIHSFSPRLTFFFHIFTFICRLRLGVYVEIDGDTLGRGSFSIKVVAGNDADVQNGKRRLFTGPIITTPSHQNDDDERWPRYRNISLNSIYSHLFIVSTILFFFSVFFFFFRLKVNTIRRTSLLNNDIGLLLAMPYGHLTDFSFLDISFFISLLLNRRKVDDKNVYLSLSLCVFVFKGLHHRTQSGID